MWSIYPTGIDYDLHAHLAKLFLDKDHAAASSSVMLGKHLMVLQNQLQTFKTRVWKLVEYNKPQKCTECKV